LKRKYVVYLLSIFIIPGFFSQSLAFGSVEWNIQKTLKLNTQPLDVAVSKNGNSIFVLTKTGKILIYSPDGELKDKIDVGNHIDITGSPFKGAENAPVTIAVFSDFQ
jgi:hypothetical protein